VTIIGAPRFQDLGSELLRISDFKDRTVYLAGSETVLEIPIQARDADIVGVRIHLPPGFKLSNPAWLERYQGDAQVFTRRDGSTIIAITERIMRGESKLYTPPLELPEETGAYSIRVVWVHYGGRSDLLADETRTPVLSCLFCNTPCRWGGGMEVEVVVVPRFIPSP
jgi:hypothetical protein